MALRCLDKITIDGVDYSLMQLSDLSFISDSYTTETQVTVSGTVVNNTDFARVHSDVQVETTYDTSLSRYTKFQRAFKTTNNEPVVKLISKEDESQKYYNIFFSGIPTDSITNVYWGIVVDDETSKGYKVLKEIRIGNTEYWTQYDPRYYDAFTGIKQTSNGGGATHIAKRTGQLKDLSSYTSDILIVSGGGGGGLLVGETAYTGKEAGGISGSGDNSAGQTTGNAFGQGESGTNLSGGGSGLYGGYKGTSSKSGGAGSGYIGNSLLSNKKMVGYNVPTSSAEGTKTESVNEVSASAVSGKPKSGNGFVRITLKSLS